MSEHIMTTYGRLPVTFVKGEGSYLWDENGDKYLDALSGIAVCGLGHAHPAVAEAICQQAKTLLHTSNLYHIPQQDKLASTLCEISGMDKVFFGNSGAEANEAAIKLAKLHAHQQGIENPVILTAHKSFHGRTMSTLSATGNPKIKAGFTPLVPGFEHVVFNDIEAIKQAAEGNNVVAVMVEPVQGEGGLGTPDADYLKQIRSLCDANGWLMILDEIQTGMCRTGEWFAFQHSEIKPDVLTLAKGMGNGVPIGACLARGKAADILQPGTHGSTFGGNPLVCAAAQATIDTMQEINLNQHVQQISNYMFERFNAELGDKPYLKDIRGKGLMIGIELDRPCAELVKVALEQHQLLINVTAESVIRLLPPLIISTDEADQIVDKVCQLISDFYA